MGDRLDADKLEVLLSWGRALETETTDLELRAAGRAIRLLCEEVDALSRDLWHVRAGVSPVLPGEHAEAAAQPPPADALQSDLRAAIARASEFRLRPT